MFFFGGGGRVNIFNLLSVFKFPLKCFHVSAEPQACGEGFKPHDAETCVKQQLSHVTKGIHRRNSFS